MVTFAIIVVMPTSPTTNYGSDISVSVVGVTLLVTLKSYVKRINIMETPPAIV